MNLAIKFDCDIHQSKYDFPEFDEYGILIKDGGTSYSTISYCPWCGTKLPNSKRDEWFETLASLGFDDPCQQNIPEKFKSRDWYL